MREKLYRKTENKIDLISKYVVPSILIGGGLVLSIISYFNRDLALGSTGIFGVNLGAGYLLGRQSIKDQFHEVKLKEESKLEKGLKQ